MGELAALAVGLAGGRSPIREAPARTYDVSHFIGDPSRARSLLDWGSRVSLRDGLRKLVRDFEAELGMCGDEVVR